MRVLQCTGCHTDICKVQRVGNGRGGVFNILPLVLLPYSHVPLRLKCLASQKKICGAQIDDEHLYSVHHLLMCSPPPWLQIVMCDV